MQAKTFSCRVTCRREHFPAGVAGRGEHFHPWVACRRENFQPGVAGRQEHFHPGVTCRRKHFHPEKEFLHLPAAQLFFASLQQLILFPQLLSPRDTTTSDISGEAGIVVFIGTVRNYINK